MGLWIRTQNNDLIECKRIMPMGNKIMEQHAYIPIGVNPLNGGTETYDDYTILGEYEDGEVIAVINSIHGCLLAEAVLYIMPPKGFTQKEKATAQS